MLRCWRDRDVQPEPFFNRAVKQGRERSDIDMGMRTVGGLVIDRPHVRTSEIEDASDSRVFLIGSHASTDDRLRSSVWMSTCLRRPVRV
jgi:hypothetical protein